MCESELVAIHQRSCTIDERGRRWLYKAEEVDLGRGGVKQWEYRASAESGSVCAASHSIIIPSSS